MKTLCNSFIIRWCVIKNRSKNILLLLLVLLMYSALQWVPFKESIIISGSQPFLFQFFISSSGRKDFVLILEVKWPNITKNSLCHWASHKVFCTFYSLEGYYLSMKPFQNLHPALGYPPKQINSPWCAWWSRPWRSCHPTHWTSCTLQALSGTSCPGSSGARRRASCHWSRCRRRCRLCGSGPWRWDSHPPGPSSDLRTRSVHTGARWTTQAPGFKCEMGII